MKNYKKFVVLLFVVLAGIASVYAHRVTLTPSLVYQHIFYKDSKYPNLNTLGAGGSLEYAYRLGKTTEAGLGLSVEQFSYPEFYDYIDFKTAVKLRQQLFSVGENGPVAIFNLNGGAGVDWVFKSNGEKELYMLVFGGLSMDLLTAERYSTPYIGLKVEAQGTFQGGSTVLHVLGGLEISYSFGGAE